MLVEYSGTFVKAHLICLLKCILSWRILPQRNPDWHNIAVWPPQLLSWFAVVDPQIEYLRKPVTDVHISTHIAEMQYPRTIMQNTVVGVSVLTRDLT